MSLIALRKQVDETDLEEMNDDKSEVMGDSTLSFNFEEYNLEQQQQVLYHGQWCQDRISRTTQVQLPKKCSQADNVI